MKPMTPMKPLEPLEPMKPMEPMRPMDPPAQWWPDGLGHPAATGSQNDLRYAYFPDSRRLAVQTRGMTKLYDTADHRISGVSQRRQNNDGGATFTSQSGDVRLEDLTVLD
jgi:hypothetical protein